MLQKYEYKDIRLEIRLFERMKISKRFKHIEELLEKGMDIDAFDLNFDESMLMYAARTGNLILLKFILGKNASIHLKNK